ncbi:MAG: TolC family protein [Undibacterium sp.]|nr:TolC family protein [Opitutaceae bacterium]
MKTYRPIFSLLAVASFALAQPAPTQPVPDTLDLPTALRFALENNFTIRQARERIKQQDGVLVEVKAKSLPNVSANGAYQRNEKEISSYAPPSDRSWTLSLTATQAIYTGGGVRSAIKSTELTREAAILELKGVVNDSLLDVRTKFYDVLLAREKIKVQESNVDLLKQQLKNVTDRFDAGTVSAFEKLRAEVALANAQVPLISARNAYRLGTEALRQSLGFASNSQESLRKVPDFVGTLDFTPVNFEIQASLDSARAGRPELARLSKLSDARDSNITTARSNYYPNLSAVGGWQLRKGSTDHFGDSRDGFLIGVQSQWNIFDGAATSGRVAQARSALEQSRLTLGEAALAVDVEVRRALSSLQEATELADASQKVVAQGEESLRLANARYSAGTATQLDVLQTQVDLTTARTNQIQAYYSYNVAVARVRKAIGLPDSLMAAN